MSIVILVAQRATATAPMPPCHAAQLRLSVDRRDGDFDGMSHSGAQLLIRNLGPDCMLPALPEIRFEDARRRHVAAVRRPPIGMHPGPAMIPVRLGKGTRAGTALRWVSGPVFADDRHIAAARVTVRFGRETLRSRLAATIHGPAGKPATFDQEPLHAM